MSAFEEGKETSFLETLALKFSLCQFMFVLCRFLDFEDLKQSYELKPEFQFSAGIALLPATVSEILGRFDCKT